MQDERTVARLEPTEAGTVLARLAYGGEIGSRTLARLVWDWLVRRAETGRQRRRLADMSPWELKDIGVTPDQAWRESRKPFWRD